MSITDEQAAMLRKKLSRSFSLGDTEETLHELCERYLQDNKHVRDAPLIKYIAACLITNGGDFGLRLAARLLGAEVTV